MKLSKTRIITITFILISFFFSGCSNVNQEENLKNNSKQEQEQKNKDYVVSDIPEKISAGVKPEKLGEPKVVEFDLGKSVIKQQYGVDVPYSMQGVLGVPEGSGKHPLVIVLHGAHRIETEDDVTNKRFDLGYEYLVKELASYGYLTLSINTNMQYLYAYGEPLKYERLNAIYNDNLEKLQQAVEGKDVGYGVDLTNRADLSQISIIGHSRGAQAPYSIYEDQKSKGRDDIKSMLLIAPSYTLDTDMSGIDVPTGIILPQLDGDVIVHDGQKFYDIFTSDKERKSWVSLVYLFGANHNFFNEALDVDDAKAVTPPVTDYEKRLTPEDQRSFVKQYAVDFLTSVFNKPVSGVGLSALESATGNLYGYKVLTSLNTPNSKVVWYPKDDNDAVQNLLGGENITDNLQAKFVMESFVPIHDPGPFNHPGMPKDLGLLSITWENKGASYTTVIPENHSDLSDYDSLSLYTAIDPSNELNTKDQNQSFTIVVNDKNGNSDSVLIDSTAPALRYQKGYIYENPYAPYWSTYTPLNSLRVPLNYFESIDLTAVESISLVFDQTDSGALMVRDMIFMKEAMR